MPPGQKARQPAPTTDSPQVLMACCLHASPRSSTLMGPSGALMNPPPPPRHSDSPANAPRPLLLTGGLKSGLRQGERAGNVVMEPAGHFGVPPSRSEPAGSILRKQVRMGEDFLGGRGREECYALVHERW